jgi:hypothetical protein
MWSRDGWIFHMMLKAAAGQFKGWAAFSLLEGRWVFVQVGILKD